MTNVSIIIPIIRPEGARRCIAAIKENAGVPESQYEIVTGEDVSGAGCPEMVRLLTNRTAFDWVMFLGDDCEPEPNFLKHAIDAIADLPFQRGWSEQWGVVGLCTQDDRPGAKWNDHAHFMAHKEMLQHIDGGNFFSTDYTHCWGDDELQDVALELNVWTFAECAKIRHHHPVNGDEWTDVHGRIYSPDAHHADYQVYLHRKIERTRRRRGVKLAVALPLTSQMVYTNFFFSYLSLEFPDGYDFFVPNHPGQIDAVRNDLVRQSLHKGCTHTLMMDTDQIYHDRDMITRLLSHKKDVVGGIVHRRYPAYDPLVLRYDADKDAHYGVPDDEIEAGGLVEVDATGCGCILFDNRVFLDIPAPWFEIKTGKHGQVVGEDIGFCKKLKQRGFQLFVDCSVKIGHLFLTEADWMKYKLYQKLKG